MEAIEIEISRLLFFGFAKKLFSAAHFLVISVNHYEGGKTESMDLEKAYDKIYRYTYFKLNDQAVAEDIVQETFLRFMEQRGRFSDYEMRYLYTIARNLCIDEFRRVKPEPLPDDYEQRNFYSGKSTEDIVMVREALSHLSVEDQELLLLRHVNKESVGTISNALGISRFALYRRLKAAENELRMRLEVEKNEG